MSDFSEAARIAAELIDKLEAEYADNENVSIQRVAVIVEVSENAEEDEKGDMGWTSINYRCSDPVRWIQIGLFEAAVRAARHGEHDT